MEWMSVERTIKTSFLIPITNGLEPKEALTWIDRLPDNEKNDDWLRATRSLVLYRAGEFRGCIESASKLRAPKGGCRPMAQLLTAMSYNRLGQAQEAVDAFARAKAAFNSDFVNGSKITVWGANENWMISQLLLREASSVFDGDHPAGSPPMSAGPSASTMPATSN